eukprot:gnl/TRDRNA2_/TRDRNA2_169969_c1_seq1.p2 gnl/TRDRNA2_/TRDRNA2_169969_c1~~gnl/TRDRNA2_/TRDRNA2_169969_c1_seq1.p2  ORF type:complete len:185 (+),score=47.44 gnl/TRDRNA2_/TRDRNA2_169969_c1_seq1:81-635(+)
MPLLLLLFFVGIADGQIKILSTCSDRLDPDLLTTEAFSTDETGFLQLAIHKHKPAAKNSAEIQTAADAMWNRANMAEGHESASEHQGKAKHQKHHKHQEEEGEEELEEDDDEQPPTAAKPAAVDKSLRKKWPFSMFTGLMQKMQGNDDCESHTHGQRCKESGGYCEYNGNFEVCKREYQAAGRS